jgi:hypothetical protein
MGHIKWRNIVIKPKFSNKITFTNIETGWHLGQRINLEGKIYHVTKGTDTETVIEHNPEPVEYVEIKYEEIRLWGEE